MIRQARAGETEVLSELALSSKSVWGYDRAFLAACVPELTVAEADLPGTFVKEHRSEIVGFYTVKKCCSGETELEYLFVAPKHLRKGYGAELFEHAKQLCLALGCRRMVIQGDPNAAGFYRHVGAANVGERASESIPVRSLPVFAIDLAADRTAE